MQLFIRNPLYFIKIYFRTKVLFFIILTGILLTIRCASSVESDRLRISFFPTLITQPWLNVLIADHLNGFMGKINSADYLTYQLDWYCNTMEMDSISYSSYLRQFGQRIELDVLVHVQIQSVSEDRCTVQLDYYHPEKKEPIVILRDSLDFLEYEPFFQRIIVKTLDILSSEVDSFPEYPIFETRLWEPYGWGKYYQLTGNIASAETFYRQGISVDTNQISLLKGLIQVLLEKASKLRSEGKYLEDFYFEIERLIHRGIEIDSMDSELYRSLGNLYIQRGMWNKAEQALDKAYEIGKDDPLLYFNLSRLHPSRYDELGFKNKTELLERAIYLNPAFQLGWIALAEDCYYRNRYDKTEEVYNRLLEIFPGSLDGLLGLGKLYMVQNDIVNIIRTYENVLEIAPDYADAYYNLGIVYYKDHQDDVAIQFFKKAIEISNHADSHYYLGIVYRNRNELDQAIYHFRKRIELKNGTGDTFAEEARIHLYELLENEG
ncbi:tetratricopeptide repeat protein [bacterium]|nr:MAG: tetratricopeptide repeat protein [bacterium]